MSYVRPPDKTPDQLVIIHLYGLLHEALDTIDELSERITLLTRLSTLYSSETSAPSSPERACCGTSCGCTRW